MMVRVAPLMVAFSIAISCLAPKVAGAAPPPPNPPKPPTFHVSTLLSFCRGHAATSFRVWVSGFYVSRGSHQVKGVQGALFDSSAVPDQSQWSRQWRRYKGLYVTFPGKIVSKHHNAVPTNTWVRVHGVVSCRSFILTPDTYPQRTPYS
ncbi:MAG: hypothetical protein PVSMB7_28830 [Chloroflexota bacterium]